MNGGPASLSVQTPERPFPGVCWEGWFPTVVQGPMPRPPAGQSGTSRAARPPRPTAPGAGRSPRSSLPPRLRPGWCGGRRRSFPKIPTARNPRPELPEKPHAAPRAAFAACGRRRRAGDRPGFTEASASAELRKWSRASRSHPSVTIWSRSSALDSAGSANTHTCRPQAGPEPRFLPAVPVLAPCALQAASSLRPPRCCRCPVDR